MARVSDEPIIVEWRGTTLVIEQRDRVCIRRETRAIDRRREVPCVLVPIGDDDPGFWTRRYGYPLMLGR